MGTDGRTKAWVTSEELRALLRAGGRKLWWYASQLCISETYLSHWLAGRRGLPLAHAARVAEALGTTLDDLVARGLLALRERAPDPAPAGDVDQAALPTASSVRLSELAALVGVSRSQLERLVARGVLRTERLGNLRLVPVEAARAVFPSLTDEQLARVVAARRRRAAAPTARIGSGGTGTGAAPPAAPAPGERKEVDDECSMNANDRERSSNR
ncbi:MAG: helix-turn-helix domain-containing protein [Dehalococcoidia bacterium]|nr:helix-turn-helix domain-containing protein [Dehalococcoidia bacterium]